MKKSVILSVAAMLCLTAPAPAAETDGIKLDSRYIDPVRGFSLRPPAGTTFSRVTSANRLASWTMRKSPKAPILWRLSIYARADETFKPGGDLLKFGRALVGRLARTEGFKAPSPRVIDIAGAKAVNLRGLTTGKVKFWQRRVWVHLGGSKFLEVRMSGPNSDRQKLDEIASAVLKTLKIIDQKEAKARRKAALDRGARLLKDLSANKLKGALDTRDQWYLYRRDDKVIGFMRQKEVTDTSSGKPGCRIKSWIVMTFDAKTLKLHRNMFAAADRSVETWKETAGVKSSGQDVSMIEKGSKSGPRINCEITVGARKVTQKPAAAPTDNYLPRAMDWLLRRMVDLKEPAAYAFATYNGRKGSFNLRTFTVIGPDEIEAGGRKVSAVHVTDQLTAETQAANMWVDMGGNLLIMKTADGLVMETASEKAVERRFPKAKETIKTMGG
ncbi:MAG: hypothetical protein QGG42_06690 [Phycisphaerae bacterium]|jgi:hypothetical protein|nr:hypothetical protein [Phycisphaerae bacterium]